MTEIVNFQQPFTLFSKYLAEACQNKNIVEPTAMCLSSSDSHNKISSRMVLLKKHNSNGFYFFTNLTSRKAQEILNRPKVALCFYWGALAMQIRIVGNAELASSQESDEYFASRPRQSQIGAWASKQSQSMESGAEFELRIAKYQEEFANSTTIPRPDFWGGFLVRPEEIEFWHEGEFRLHNRLHYQILREDNSDTKENLGWKVTKLYP